MAQTAGPFNSVPQWSHQQMLAQKLLHPCNRQFCEDIPVLSCFCLNTAILSPPQDLGEPQWIFITCKLWGLENWSFAVIGNYMRPPSSLKQNKRQSQSQACKGKHCMNSLSPYLKPSKPSVKILFRSGSQRESGCGEVLCGGLSASISNTVKFN